MGAQLAAIRYLKVPDLMTVVLTMTIIGALTERGRGWTDAVLLRRGLALVAFAVGALSGALLVLYVGVAAALLLGLANHPRRGDRRPSGVAHVWQLVGGAVGVTTALRGDPARRVPRASSPRTPTPATAGR